MFDRQRTDDKEPSYDDDDAPMIQAGCLGRLSELGDRRRPLSPPGRQVLRGARRGGHQTEYSGMVSMAARPAVNGSVLVRVQVPEPTTGDDDMKVINHPERFRTGTRVLFLKGRNKATVAAQ